MKLKRALFVGICLALVVATTTFIARVQAGGSTVSETPSDDAASVDRDADSSLVLLGLRRSKLPFTQREAGALSAEQTRWRDDNCKFGVPRKDASSAFGPTKVVIREGYVLESSLEDKMPLWVAEHAVAAELGGSLPRDNRFRPDPELSGMPRAELSDFRGSGFDRGHMAPAGNQTVAPNLKLDTFFLSNMVPQVGPRFNQTIWAELEKMVRDWAETRGDAWIITGGFFYDEQEEDPSTADGFVEVDVIGRNQVAVPTHLYKIVIAPEAGSGKLKVIAFVMKNEPYSRPFRFEKYLKSIDWIEARTGLNFMPDIATAGVPGLENELESTAATVLW